MNPSLTEALALLNLQPGDVYRTTVNGRAVEVRVLKARRAEASWDEPSLRADQERIDLWLDIPLAPTGRTLTVQSGGPLWPSPFHLTEADLAPE